MKGLMRYIVLHHSGTARDNTNLDAIRRDHFNRIGSDGKKWGRTFYQSFIEPDGNVTQEHKINNDRRNGNTSKDICVVGDFTKENPTFQQRWRMARIIEEWLRAGNDASTIIGHTEIGDYNLYGTQSVCPGRLMEQIAEWPRKKLYLKLRVVTVADSATAIDKERYMKALAEYCLPFVRIEWDYQHIDEAPVWSFNSEGKPYQIDTQWIKSKVEVTDHRGVILLVQHKLYAPGAPKGKIYGNDRIGNALFGIVDADDTPWTIGGIIPTLFGILILIHEVSHMLYGFVQRADLNLRRYIRDETHSPDGLQGDFMLGWQQLVVALETVLPTSEYMPPRFTQNTTPEPDPWQRTIAEAIASTQVVFGKDWKPSPKMYKLGKVDEGKIWAVRVEGSKKPWVVYVGGPAGYRVKNRWAFLKEFKTLNQDGIVGTVTPWQAKLLGITDIDSLKRVV